MVTNEELWKLYEQTEDGCNKKCDTCPLFLKTKDRCIHEDMEKWQQWAKKQHEEFGEMSRVYE